MEVQSVLFWSPGKALSPEYRRVELIDHVVLYKEFLSKFFSPVFTLDLNFTRNENTMTKKINFMYFLCKSMSCNGAYIKI